MEIIKKFFDTCASNEVIQIVRPVSGGDINQTYYVETDSRKYFVKLNPQMPIGFF